MVTHVRSQIVIGCSYSLSIVQFRSKFMHLTSDLKALELHTSNVQIYNFNFQKIPVDCDVMMHALKNFEIFI